MLTAHEQQQPENSAQDTKYVVSQTDGRATVGRSDGRMEERRAGEEGDSREREREKERRGDERTDGRDRHTNMSVEKKKKCEKNLTKS